MTLKLYSFYGQRCGKTGALSLQRVEVIQVKQSADTEVFPTARRNFHGDLELTVHCLYAEDLLAQAPVTSIFKQLLDKHGL